MSVLSQHALAELGRRRAGGATSILATAGFDGTFGLLGPGVLPPPGLGGGAGRVSCSQYTQVQSCASGSKASRYQLSAASNWQCERSARATASDGLNGERGNRLSPGASKTK